MKKCIFFLTIIISSCSVMQQQVANPYEIAYRFIIKDLMTKPQHVAVSDSLNEFDNNTAIFLLSGSNDSSYKYDSICQDPTTNNYNHNVSTSALKNPFHYLLFSRMQNGMIMAEVIDYQHFIKYNNDRFTTIRLYLLFFDEKMRIKKSIVTNVITD